LCILCDACQPWADECPYTDDLSTNPDTSGEDSGTLSTMPVFNYDQIANQLTNVYWGGSDRAFDTGPDNTLYVDITGLT
ncbi:unnamed protein product, partial [Ectocarpus sp. 12 AP-2014]